MNCSLRRLENVPGNLRRESPYIFWIASMNARHDSLFIIEPPKNHARYETLGADTDMEAHRSQA